ncbi:hypothetical protein BHE74_00031721 [Ensete ventricosum]|nr:hypothetical protein BHE74_00031721 [Ensete ventricosum]
MQRWLATAWLATRGRPTRAKAPYKGGCGLRPGAAPAGTAGYGQPIGAVAAGSAVLARGPAACARKGMLPAASPTSSRGDSAGRRGGPLAGRLSTGKGNRRLRRGSDGGGVEGGKRPRAFLLRKGLFCPSKFEKF